MSRTPPAWPRPDGAGAASAPTSRSPSGPPSRVGARPQRARVRRPSSAPPWGRSTGHRRTAASQAARATAPEARGAARSARSHCADASHPGPRARVRCSGRVTARSSAGQSSSPRRHPRSCDPALTTRSPESASSRSDPGPTGASLPDPLRSDDQQPAPWLASAPQGAPAYPLRDRTGIQAESIARTPYELARRVRAATPDRYVHLILENEDNEAHRLERDLNGIPRAFTAQWNDDVHHVLHTAATGETSGYYGEYTGDMHKLGRALAEGFAFQGEMMTYRGHPRGEPSAHLPPTAFVSFIQNHDQVGNRAFGDRITAKTPHEAVRAIAAVYLLAPQIPMLFMGEEWAAAQPFPFFCDFGPDLAAAVRKGRREEFARFPEFQDPACRERIPDPTAPETFRSAKLDWSVLEHEPHSTWLSLYKRLLAVRRIEIVPRLAGAGLRGGSYELIGKSGVHVCWSMGDGTRLTLVANLGPDAVERPRVDLGRVILAEGPVHPDGLGPWSVVWSLEPGDRNGQG